MSSKPSLATLLIVSGFLLGLTALWVTLKTTANQKQFALRLMALEGDVQDLHIAQTNTLTPELLQQYQQVTSNVTAQIDALRIELKGVPAPLPPAPDSVGGISSPGQNRKYYIIRSGDTFTSIAQEHGIALEDLEDVNPGMDHDDLDVGQRIKIPLYPVAE